MIWSSILTIPIAIFEAICSLILLLTVTLFALGIGGALSDYDLSHKCNRTPDIQRWNKAIKDFAVPDLAAKVTSSVAVLLLIVVLIFLGYFILCVLLCKGVCEKKPPYIIAYLILKLVALITRGSTTNSDFRNFSTDTAALSFVIQGVYLVLLIINIIEIKNEKKGNRGGMITAAAPLLYTSPVGSPPAGYSYPAGYSQVSQPAYDLPQRND